MSSRLKWLQGSPLRECSAQATLARDCSERGRRAGSAGSHGRARGGGRAPDRTASSRASVVQGEHGVEACIVELDRLVKWEGEEWRQFPPVGDMDQPLSS